MSKVKDSGGSWLFPQDEAQHSGKNGEGSGVLASPIDAKGETSPSQKQKKLSINQPKQGTLFPDINVPKIDSTYDSILLSKLENMSVQELENEVRKHNDLYNQGRPEIEDSTYDRLVEVLRERSPQNDVADELTSPELSGISKGKIVHEIPMLSIHKPNIRRVFEEIGLWLEKFDGDVMVTPKIDGLACSIQYDQNGDLYIASTRGNGRVGENITANAYYIHAIPKHIDIPNLEVRGEVYMPLSAFEKFDGEKISARNLAVGGLKQKNAAETEHYHLSFFAYEAVGMPFKTDSEKFDILEKLGFTVPEHHVLKRMTGTSDALKHLLHEIEQFCFQMTGLRESWDFDADGLVFKVDDNEVQQSLGNTDHHPRCAIAYKFPCQEQESTLREVRWQVAKGGRMTPVALFDTVELAGARVQKATLSNVDMIRHFPIGKPELNEENNRNGRKTHLKIGSKILVSRRGDVIPHVEYIISEPVEAIEVEIPSVCSSCGGPVRENGKFLLCTNSDDCPATGQALIENYTKVIGCLGFGEKIIENLYDTGCVETPADLYRLTIENIAQAIATSDDGTIDPDAIMPSKLYDAIQSARDLPLAKFLESLSIPALGRVNSQKLADHFENIDDVLRASVTDLIPVVGGEIMDEDDIRKNRNKSAAIYRLIHESLKENEQVLNDDFRRELKMTKGEGAEFLKQCRTLGELKQLSMEDIYQILFQSNRMDKTAQAIRMGLDRRRNIIDDLRQYVNIIIERKNNVEQNTTIFTGKTVLFTGALEHMKREEAQALVENMGGKAATGVSKNLSILVATSNTSSKWLKAQELNEKGANILLWTEEDFMAAIEGIPGTP